MDFGSDKPRRRRERRSRRGKGNEEESKREARKAPSRRADRVSKVVTIPMRNVGLLIGTGGENVRRLKDRTHCRISLVDSDPEEEPAKDLELKMSAAEARSHARNRPKRVLLEGSPEEIDDCVTEIEFMVENGRFMLDSERGYKTGSAEEVAKEMRVPSKICGMLIGSGGQRVKEIQTLTGAQIFVQFNDDQHIEAGVSVIKVKGTERAVAMAEGEIRRILDLFGGAGGKGAKSIRFEVPSFAARQIVGPNGETVRQLQSDFFVNINIKKIQASSTKYDPRMNREIQRTDLVEIVGEFQDMEDAKRAILQMIGTFRKCEDCARLVLDSNGRYDPCGNHQWFCDDCWDKWTNPVPDDPLPAQTDFPPLQDLSISGNPRVRRSYPQRFRT